MIKKKMYILLLALSTWGFQSCDNDDDSIQVPTELQQAFSSMYPAAGYVEWETKGQYYVADFRNNQYDASAWYTANGQWYMTETDISYSALPQSVRTSFEASTNEYSKAPWRREDVDKLERQGFETTYVIEVENSNQEVDLYYSEDGILIKTVVDLDNDDDSSGYLPSSQLTAEMKAFINQRYPEAKIMETDMEDDRNDPEFGYIEVDIIHDRKAKEVVFDKKGAWAYTKWDVLVSTLPNTITEKVATQYAGYRIDDAEYFEKENESYYLLELEKVGGADLQVKFPVVS